MAGGPPRGRAHAGPAAGAKVLVEDLMLCLLPISLPIRLFNRLCPYQQFHHDCTTVIHYCDRGEGRCSAYCPRSPADLNGLRAALFDPADLTPELFEEAIRDLMPPPKVPINLEAFEMGRRALVAA